MRVGNPHMGVPMSTSLFAENEGLAATSVASRPCRRVQYGADEPLLGRGVSLAVALETNRQRAFQRRILGGGLGVGTQVVAEGELLPEATRAGRHQVEVVGAPSRVGLAEPVHLDRAHTGSRSGAAARCTPASLEDRLRRRGCRSPAWRRGPARRCCRRDGCRRQPNRQSHRPKPLALPRNGPASAGRAARCGPASRPRRSRARRLLALPVVELGGPR
jgi:hypothetical protein